MRRLREQSAAAGEPDGAEPLLSFLLSVSRSSLLSHVDQERVDALLAEPAPPAAEEQPPSDHARDESDDDACRAAWEEEDALSDWDGDASPCVGPADDAFELSDPGHVKDLFDAAKRFEGVDAETLSPQPLPPDPLQHPELRLPEPDQARQAPAGMWCFTCLACLACRG